MTMEHVAGEPTVTLDVLHTGITWGWYVTMNMWAKSVGTGVLLVGAYMMRRHAGSQDFYRKWMPILGFLFVQLTLLFTVLDLHQMFRFWHDVSHIECGLSFTLADRINSYPDPVQARKDFVARQPMGRLAQAQEIAPIVLYLASDESVFATGQVFSVDGGMMI